MWKSENNSWGPILCFHQEGSGDQTQVFGLGSKCLSPLSNLANLHTFADKVKPRILEADLFSLPNSETHRVLSHEDNTSHRTLASCLEQKERV